MMFAAILTALSLVQIGFILTVNLSRIASALERLDARHAWRDAEDKSDGK